MNKENLKRKFLRENNKNIQREPGAVNLTTHCHLVLRLKMRGATPPLPQHAFITWYLVKHGDNFVSTLCYKDNLTAWRSEF
jgi:hypothetical protein